MTSSQELFENDKEMTEAEALKLIDDDDDIEDESTDWSTPFCVSIRMNFI